MNDSLQRIVRHCDGGSAEGVGLHHVASSLKVGTVDILYYFRSRETEKIIVALQLFVVSLKQVSAKVLLFQLVLLDHGTHGTIQVDNTLL